MAKKTQSFQAPRGTYDILPQEQKYWERIKKIVRELAVFYGFERIDTPIIEDADLFSRGLGLTSEVVEKQMYVFKTRGGDELALRPEGTASVIRAYIEHGLSFLPQPLKLYYFGPMFRHESPQKGRFRQFYQWGFEILGEKDAVADAQLILMSHQIFKELGLSGFNIQINSIGCKKCRLHFRDILKNYYKSLIKRLCSDCKRRFKENPFRLFDCKNENCVGLRKAAPQIIEYLCEECHNHFKQVLEFLDEVNLPYILNPYLFRGLDYYGQTVFEFWLEKEFNPANFALGGGGRYNYLVEMLGGKPTPAVGGAFGCERVIEVMKFQSVKAPEMRPKIKVFLAQLGILAKQKSLKLMEEFRHTGISVAESFGRDSIKAQLRVADRLRADWVLILGQKEALDGTIILREMSSGAQEIIPQEKIIEMVKKRLSSK
ncbi:MAG: histidine--tRNA ligase [bacterium]|nr:histidine--tRNA ligase [bacterium]